MKSTAIITILLFSFLAVSAAGEKSGPANKYVKFSSQIKKKSFKPGEKGEILVSLKPVKGIHINLTPAMSVRFDTTGGAKAGGEMEIPKKGEYLDAMKEVRIPFVVPAVAKPGNATLKAEFTYYYCSDAEGWCSRFKQPIELSLTVAK